MPGSKELNNVIKSFLKTCNITAEASTYLETGLQYGDSVQFALDSVAKPVLGERGVKPKAMPMISSQHSM